VGLYITPMTGYTNRFALRRSEVNRMTSAIFTCYENPEWWDLQNDDGTAVWNFGNVLAENVTSFEVWLYYNDRGVLKHESSYDSADWGPPVLADIFVELLGESDAIKADTIQSFGDPSAALEFVNEKAKGYMARVYFRNREGYTGDR
jgi:hypothetical protein